MTTTMSKWIVPIVGFIIGILIAAAELGRHASPAQAAVAFAIVAGYAIALRLLQSRSDLASLLSGLPRDERWAVINLRALSLAGQLVAVVLVLAFITTEFAGGDAQPYALVGAIFAVGYLGGLVWYRVRS
jgi:Na+/H+ antiporter NhaD/arsenite permease-like protein